MQGTNKLIFKTKLRSWTLGWKPTEIPQHHQQHSFFQLLRHKLLCVSPYHKIDLLKGVNIFNEAFLREIKLCRKHKRHENILFLIGFQTMVHWQKINWTFSRFKYAVRVTNWCHSDNPSINYHKCYSCSRNPGWGGKKIRYQFLRMKLYGGLGFLLGEVLNLRS